MPDEPSKSVDLFGIKPVAEAFQKAVEGAGAVLGRICLPAAEELGLMFRDRVSHWRQVNAIELTKRLEKKMAQNKTPPGVNAHPRLVHQILEQASLTDDATIQDMWAGLLASSCTPNGDDDSNLIFTNLLSGLTKLQAKIVKYGCENAVKELTPGGLLAAQTLDISFDDLCQLTGEKDVHRLDRELDHLRGVGLLEDSAGGFSAYDPSRQANITPSTLALHLYVRCQGSRASPDDFFKLGGGQPAAQPTAPSSTT